MHSKCRCRRGREKIACRDARAERSHPKSTPLIVGRGRHHGRRRKRAVPARTSSPYAVKPVSAAAPALGMTTIARRDHPAKRSHAAGRASPNRAAPRRPPCKLASAGRGTIAGPQRAARPGDPLASVSGTDGSAARCAAPAPSYIVPGRLRVLPEGRTLMPDDPHAARKPMPRLSQNHPRTESHARPLRGASRGPGGRRRTHL